MNFRDMLKKYGKIYNPESYLEIGVNEGDSLAALLSVCTPKEIYICDLWGTAYGGTGRGSPQHIIDRLNGIGYKNALYIFNGDSHVAIPISSKQFDFITVDGDHSYAGALSDLRNCYFNLKPGGLMFFDDTNHPNHKYLTDVAERFAKECNMTILEKSEDEVGYYVFKK